MRSFTMMAVCIGVLVATLAGCSSTTGIPAGAQQVRVVATATHVSVDPATAHAGDIYFVLDIPDGATVIWVTMTGGAPMTDADLARVTHGDTEGTAFNALSVGGDAALRAQKRGQIGFGGNVWNETVRAGKYAVMLLAPNSDQAPEGLPPLSIAVLEILP